MSRGRRRGAGAGKAVTEAEFDDGSREVPTVTRSHSTCHTRATFARLATALPPAALSRPILPLSTVPANIRPPSLFAARQRWAKRSTDNEPRER
ncbi:uncharacterized protein FOMMEDRAFT_159369 [Fomitiporia mediterranea MF3/22]|uniref:uncharacterized protein n=1 Tax=Fomitiporia mediterranea (strain MF3/22) TaxID=694068 RepID=UPI0004407318|nr:uncharacterized protein FOMMEDRAFT_159369 [Fomitiporia mediterranea MF3/22]EJD00610.1 hypothetical protein FOMMEDRAFT_159369 [Fomitiporia mediterranea MF3/22]